MLPAAAGVPLLAHPPAARILPGPTVHLLQVDGFYLIFRTHYAKAAGKL